MRYFIHQTQKEIRLVTVSAITDGKVNARMKGFRIETGSLETWEKDETMPASFPDRLLKHGYAAITEPEYQQHLETTGAALLLQTQAPQGQGYDIVPWETIEAQFAPAFLNDVNEYLPDPSLRNFCLYTGDTVIDGDMMIDFSELGATTVKYRVSTALLLFHPMC